MVHLEIICETCGGKIRGIGASNGVKEHYVEQCEDCGQIEGPTIVVKTALADKINAAINELDEEMSYKTLAQAVAEVLKNEYGQHNYAAFVDYLGQILKDEN